MGRVYREARERKLLREVNAARVDRAVTHADLEEYARGLPQGPITHISVNNVVSHLSGPRALEIVRHALKAGDLE
jgi:hypothetical protein